MQPNVFYKSSFLELVLYKRMKHDDYYEDSHIKVFVRGNGYRTNNVKWLVAEDIALLIKEGRFNTDEIDGTFLILIVLKGKNKIIILTDHLNFFPLYKKAENKLFILSDSLHAFKNEPLDSNGINQLLATGSILGNRTLYKEILKLPAASKTTATDGKSLKSELYWQCKPMQTSESNFKKVFSETIDLIPILSEKPSLTLTAGLDSRMVLSQAIRNDISIDAFTFGFNTSPDVRIAKKIAKKFNINHQTYELTKKNKYFNTYFEDAFKENLFLSDGIINCIKSIHTNFCFRKEAENHDMLVTATGELVYSHYAEVPTLFAKNNTNIKSIARFLAEFNSDFSATDSNELDSIAKAIEDQLLTYQFEDNILYYDGYYLEKLSSFTSYLQQIISYRSRVFNPIFTKRMISASLGLPPISRRGRNFQRRLIVENEPLLNAFLVNGFKVVKKSGANQTIAKTAYALRLFKKLINKVVGKELFRISYVHYPSLVKGNQFLKNGVMNRELHSHLKKFKKSRITFNSKLNLYSLNGWLNSKPEDHLKCSQN